MVIVLKKNEKMQSLQSIVAYNIYTTLKEVKFLQVGKMGTGFRPNKCTLLYPEMQLLKKFIVCHGIKMTFPIPLRHQP